MGHPIRVLVVDDEQPARGTIQLILKQIENVEVVGECDNGEACLDYVADHGDAIDLIFLDIEMPHMSGMEAAAAIKERAPQIQIVFSTGYSQFAVEAFALEAFDYILKPYRRKRIQQTISRFQAVQEMAGLQPKETVSVTRQKQKIIIRMDDKIRLLAPKEEIVFITNMKVKGTRFFTTDGIIESKTPLKDFESAIPAEYFIRTNRCYWVNLDFIQDIIPWYNDTYMLVMKGYEKYQVPVTRTYIKEFKNMLGL